jgi:hypothetical protein
MARAPKAPVMNLIFNIERNETISAAGAASSFKDPQVLVSFTILAEIEPKQKEALFRWLQTEAHEMTSTISSDGSNFFGSRLRWLWALVAVAPNLT